MKTCPCCHQALPKELPFGLDLSPFKLRILDIVRRAGKVGIPATALFDRIYGDDPDGGPTSGLACIHTHVWHINQELRKIRKVVRANLGAGAVYTLRDLA